MIYSGLGLLALGIYGFVFFLVWLGSLYLTNDANRFFDNLFVSFFACSIAAVSVWLIGRWLNKLNPLQVLEFVEGERRVVSRPRHTIYSLEMEYWGLIFAVITFGVIIGKKMGLF